MGKGATNDTGKYLFRSANVCCSDSVWICGRVCCVAAVVKYIFLALECRSMLYICVKDVMVSAFIVRRGAAGARAWEV